MRFAADDRAGARADDEADGAADVEAGAAADAEADVAAAGGLWRGVTILAGRCRDRGMLAECNGSLARAVCQTQNANCTLVQLKHVCLGHHFVHARPEETLRSLGCRWGSL